MGDFKIYKLVKKYDTPLYVYDQEKIVFNYKKIYDAFSSQYHDFRICYAVKVNNNLAILALLKKIGCGFDCSSMGEIYLAKKAGADFIIYTGNYNSEEELKYAIQNNVDVINLDDISLLEKLERIKIPDIISFRVNPGFCSKDTLFHLAGKESKFGISKNNVLNAYREAQNLGIKKFGIHMMIGSCCLSPSYFEVITRELMKLTVSIKKELNIDMDFIDIGGGFGIPYTEKEAELNIDAAAKKVTNLIKEYVKINNLKSPTLVIEPGRYITGNAGCLIGKVQSIKKSYKKFVGIDASINSILRIPLFRAQHKISVLNKSEMEKKEIVTLCGQICWDGDIIRKDIELPILKEKDIIIIHDTGAYGFCHSNQFNTRRRPAEILVAGDKLYIIRKREKLAEFDRLVEIPEHLQI